MSSTKTKKPWVDQEGNALEDKVIRKISKAWNQEMWDEYLYDTGVDKPLSSYESTYSTFSDLLDENDYTNKAQPSGDFNLSKHLDELKKDSRILLHLTYWEELPLSKVSEALCKTYFKTSKLKKETLEELKSSIERDHHLMEAYCDQY